MSCAYLGWRDGERQSERDRARETGRETEKDRETERAIEREKTFIMNTIAWHMQKKRNNKNNKNNKIASPEKQTRCNVMVFLLDETFEIHVDFLLFGKRQKSFCVGTF